MKINRLFLILMAVMCPLSITAQFRSSLLLQQNGKQQVNAQGDRGDISIASDWDKTGYNINAVGSILQVSSDKSEAYYQHVAKQYGWYVGIGPALTQEEAGHLNVIYKLSNKNSVGHWTKMEAVDGYGNHTNAHNISNYINLLGDGKISAEWSEKLDQVCQWEFMQDASGEKLILERGYDENMNLIYNYQPVFISENEICGSYTDSWGRPAKLDGTANFMINLTLDQWGNDSIIKIIDSNGDLIKNKNGAWMVRNINDQQGNVIESFSLNKVGGKMNDVWGNCSYKVIVDRYGNVVSERYYDAGGHKTRLSPDLTPDNANEVRYTYDRWHRNISKSFYDEESRDTTFQGVHRIDYSYNRHGKLLSRITKDLNGKPCPYEKVKSAFDYYQYDEEGRQLSFTRLNTDSTLLKSDEYYGKMLHKYDHEKLKQFECYLYNDSDSLLWHFELYSPKVNIYFHRNQEAYIDTLDHKGKILSRTYVSYDQDPIALPERMPSILYYPHSRFVKSYLDAPHTSTVITTWYDKNGRWARSNKDPNSPARTIIMTDSLNHTITHTEYGLSAIIQANYREVYDNSFNKLLYKQSLTTMGEVGRSGLNDALYYKAKVEYTPSGEVESILFLNEFDEPAYVVSDYRSYCYQVNERSGKVFYYDENKSVIGDDSHPSKIQAACLEITKESGHTYGFKDGDILVRYGDWYYTPYQESNHQAFVNIYAKMIFSASNDSIDIWVLRHHLEEKNSKIIKLRVPGKTASDLGFTVHEIYYTYDEAKRYIQTYLEFKEKEELAGTYSKQRTQQANHIAGVIVPQYTNKYYRAYHHKGWKNPALLISQKDNGNAGWPASDSEQIRLYNGKKRLYISGVEQGVNQMSEDGHHLRRDSIDDIFLETSKVVYLTDDEHMKALEMLKQAKDYFPSDFITEKNNYMYSSQVLESQPTDAIHSYEFIQSIQKVPSVYIKDKPLPQILNHIEGIDSAKVLKIYSSFGTTATKYRELTYQLDKNYFTSKVEPKDTAQIAEKGIAFLHETTAGIDEVLYMSADTIVWAKGRMTHGSKEIIRKNMFGEHFQAADKYSDADLRYNKKAKNEEASYDIAKYWQEQGAFEKSIRVLKYLSRKKYSRANVALSQIYLKGLGVPADTTRAVHCYRKALKHGESVPEELAKLYYDKHQDKEAIRLLKRVNSSDAYYLIGSLYEHGGNGIKTSLDSALYYYKLGKKIDRNYNRREKFRGVIDRIRAQRRYLPEDFRELPAQMVNSMSADSLFSKGVEFDDDEDYTNAYPYMKAASDAQYPEAEEYMAQYMEKPELGFNDFLKAREYRQRAVAHYLARAEHDSTAYSNLAALYALYDIDGMGIDMEKAKSYYNMGVQKYDVESSRILGNIYRDEYNYAKAFEPYFTGAQVGDAECMYQVAQLYEQGLGGVERDVQEAIYWYQKCYQANESDDAQKALDRLGVPLVQR